MPRYVILEHDWPERHWDFMLEAGPVLRTWRLAAPPEAGRPVRAEPSFDHRTAYLDYEGPVSGGRGQVVRWDAGMFVPESEESRRVAVRLQGTRLTGLAVIEADSEGRTFLHFNEAGNPANRAVQPPALP